MFLGVIILAYSYFFLFYLADWMDNRIPFRLKTLPLMMGGFVANAVVGAFMQLGGLLRCGDQQHWAKTDHGISARAVSARECAPRLKQKVA